jgi:hypothetical protein
VPVFASDPDIKVDIVDKLGNIGIARFNHLNPPCNNAKMRELHRKPVAFAPQVIGCVREGPSDLLRRSARCAECVSKGATLHIEVGLA